jgi:branched-chain amino acid transport system permease protein
MTYLFHVLILIGIYSILTMSLNLVIGYIGLPSLGHISFYCIGAYTSALLSLRFSISPWLGLLLGGCLAALASITVSLPAIRLKDDYLALATMGLGVIVYGLTKNLTDLTNGSLGLAGIPSFTILGNQLSSLPAYLSIVVVGVLVTYLTLFRIINSPFGRVMKSIRDDEIAALAIGININLYKIVTMAIGAFFAGTAGALYAHYITFIDPSSFTVTESLTVMLMVIFGGVGSLNGSILGTVCLIIFPESMRFLGIPSSLAAPTRQVLYGAILIFLMLKRPQGLLGEYYLK